MHFTYIHPNAHYPAWRHFMVAVVVLTLAILYSLVASQQAVRLDANDILIQRAEETSASLSSGSSIESAIPHQQTLFSQSLVPYVIVTDNEGVPRAASVRFQGNILTPPPEVLKSSREKGIAYADWRPETGIRQAVVIKPYEGAGQSGYVIAGRSLQETDRRENTLLQLALAAWIIGLITLFLLHFQPRIRLS